MSSIRKAAVAGSWYPGTAAALTAAVDRYLDNADRAGDLVVDGELCALVVPHAGLKYSGPVAAHAYRLLRGRRFDVAVLVGPSHFVLFDGVAVYPGGGFETPLGVTRIDEAVAQALLSSSPVVHDDPRPHAREHSLEMQLPFLARLAPELPIVPLLIGHQTAATAHALGGAIAAAAAGKRALLVASSDLSHYLPASEAAMLDGVVVDCVGRLDAEALQAALDGNQQHACGGGAMVAVMRAARLAGARHAVVLNYADSGDVSGNKSAVVGYLAAACGDFGARTS